MRPGSDILAKQQEILRGMSPEDKLRVSQGLRDDAWAFKAAWLRQLHPDWTDAEVQDAVRRLFRDVSA